MTTAVGRSDPGKARAVNEDAFFVDPELQLFVVADGLGGHQGGEVAARIAVDTVAEFVRSSRSDRQITWPYGLDAALSFEANQLRNAVQLANQRVFDESRRRPGCDGMKSTVVAAMVMDDRLSHVSVGDSRLYLHRRSGLRQLTTDTSWAASMRRAGLSDEAVRVHPMRHVLTSAVGAPAPIHVTVGQETLEDGDLLLMCTDGLYGTLRDGDITAAVSGSETQLDRAADRLVECANAAGGPDNVTVLLVRYARHAEEVARQWNA